MLGAETPLSISLLVKRLYQHYNQCMIKVEHNLAMSNSCVCDRIKLGIAPSFDACIYFNDLVCYTTYVNTVPIRLAII